MNNYSALESVAPGLFAEGKVRSELLITPELFQQHLDVATALPKNITKVTALFNDDSVVISAEVSHRMALIMNGEKEFVFTIHIDEFHLSEERSNCSITLDGDIPERGEQFVGQIVVSFIEDLVIFLLMGKRERFASRYTESLFSWPSVTVDLSTIEEVGDIENWEGIQIALNSVTSKGILLEISEP